MLRSSVLCCACLLGAGLAVSADDYRLSGPYTQDNLSLFLIHGEQGPRARSFLTLQEALDQKKVVVYETGNVNELAIENLSSEEVYIQSGDIVKGGRQDRVFPDDFVLPSTSGKVPIASFCVEQGRWTRRGSERADRFSASTDAVATKSLKVAARKKEDQGEVWQEVAAAQAGLAQAVRLEPGLAGRSAGGVDAGVASGVGRTARVPVGSANAQASLALASPTSMQLALENKKVNAAAGAYIKRLSKIIDAQPDVVGYAFAINGKLNSADVYASRDLFQRMWPKLLKASSVEAVAERRNQKRSSPVDAAAIRATLADAEHGSPSSKDIAGRLEVVTLETEKTLLFETRDRQQSGGWIHKSYVTK
jgi:hypothetical protein